MIIKFESDDDFPLGKTFIILDMIIVAASVLEKNKFPIFFDMNACISYKNVTVKKSVSEGFDIDKKNCIKRMYALSF